MQLSKHLILFQYILQQFGYDDFERLRDEFNNKQTGYDTTGRSFFANSLLGTKKTLDNRLLLQYDESISQYEKRLRTNRSEPQLTFKYYQYFSLLFTEYFFDRLSTNSNTLLKDLNEFKKRIDDFQRIENFQLSDLKKIAYWMATGSGKTLLMHCNYWQIIKYFRNWENIILLTPNEGMSLQHYEELRLSGIPAKLYSGSEESLKTTGGEILIIEITKLVKDKEGEGVSVDVDYFVDSQNLVFIDEGHKGQRSEEKAWKRLRETITQSEGSFTFEYSATFGQIISATTPDLLNEYGKAIIFDYSYRYFHADGYGKAFSIFNIDERNNYSATQTRILLTAGLLGFYEQMVLFENHKVELRYYNIEKPLWIFVGSKVIGSSSSLTQTDKQNISDVTLIVNYFQSILANPMLLQTDIDKILENQSNLHNTDGEDIFKDSFQYLRMHRPEAEDILNKVFHGAGQLDAFQIKHGDGEIGLRTHSGESYFGVINIGDVAKYSKRLEEDSKGSIVMQDDNFSPSLFHNLSSSRSTINILIGSKKFIEGWNSWRVSSMGLMNMGKSEGTQIIQLFGRGVRLKGKGFSLKRETVNAPNFVRPLQTINIFGLNASYINTFLSFIEKETIEYKEFPIEIKFNEKEKWEHKALTFKKGENHKFENTAIELVFKPTVLRRVKIDLRPRVSVVTNKFENQVAEDAIEYLPNIMKRFGRFIDFSALHTEIRRYALNRNYYNLFITKEAVIQIIEHTTSENIVYQTNQFSVKDALNGKIQDIAGYVVKDYINKYYTDREKDALTRNLTFEFLTDSHTVFPENHKMLVRVPKEKASEIEEFIKDIQRIYEEDIRIIPTIHFDKHLYSPIATWEKGKKFQEIKTVPTKLNEGETQFLKHLRSYLISTADQLVDKEIFILRNLSQRGVGFFIESSSFFPDFILWIIEGKKQNIFFLDPKGIYHLSNFKDDKIDFCTHIIQEINTSVKEKIKTANLGIEINIDALILSVTKYSEVSAKWGEGYATVEDFKNNHVLFIDEDKRYLEYIFKEFLK